MFDQRQGVQERHVLIEHALQYRDAAMGADRSAKQQKAPPVLDQRSGDRIGLSRICRGPEPEALFENGALGHLDLTVAVRMDWHEGFQIYGEHGSAIGKIFNPWYYKSSEVDLFHEKDSTTSRVLGADGHFYRRQLEAFADAILKHAPMEGASIEDGMASVRAMAAISESVQSGKRVLLSDAVGEI